MELHYRDIRVVNTSSDCKDVNPWAVITFASRFLESSGFVNKSVHLQFLETGKACECGGGEECYFVEAELSDGV